MFREIALAAIAGALLVSAGWAKDAEPEILKRSENWVVDYDRDACHLIAKFGTGDGGVGARFTRYAPGSYFDFSLYGSRFRSSDISFDAAIDFGIGGQIERGGISGTFDKQKAVFFNSMRLDSLRWNRDEILPDVLPAQEAAVTGVTVAIRGKRRFRLDFGSLEKPLAQLRKCTADLVRHWGYDPDVQAALTRPVTPAEPPQNWIRHSDYPSAASRRGTSGLVQFRLDVDPQGKVIGCYILARTSPDEFADVTCNAIKRRAKLQPALDAQGKPVRSYYINKAFWKSRS